MHKKLLDWSRKEYKELPWRKDRNLYTTLVSEIMLQQTTVSTVKKHYGNFLKIFPTIFDLANATEAQVCAQWQGLGYYRRARNLHKAAQTVVTKYNGEFPNSHNELKSIPGIGDYTASALIAIGRNKVELALDANLERVLSRYFLIEELKGLKLQKEIRKRLFENQLKIDFKKFPPRDLNEALMDLGRVFCQARKADCLLCPISESCMVKIKGMNPLDYPKQSDKGNDENKNHDLLLLRVLIRKGDKILGYVKEEGEWLSGQVEIPTFVLKSTDKKLKQYPDLKTTPRAWKAMEIPTIKTAITKYKIQNQIVELNPKQFQELIAGLDLKPNYKYFKLNIQDHHFSTTTLKVFKKAYPEEII